MVVSRALRRELLAKGASYGKAVGFHGFLRSTTRELKDRAKALLLFLFSNVVRYPSRKGFASFSVF